MKEREIENLVSCHKDMLAAKLAQCQNDYERFFETQMAYNFLCDRLLGKI